MRDYLEEYHKNLVLIDRFLIPMGQSVLRKDKSRNILWNLLFNWAIIYCIVWECIYMYLMFVEDADIVLLSGQFWCMMTIMQTLSKLISGAMGRSTTLRLLRWCEDLYTAKHKPKYQRLIDKVFEETNKYVGLCVRINSVFVCVALLFYLVNPLVQGNRMTPTPLSFGGVTYLSMPRFVSLYLLQSIHSLCVAFTLCGYDAIFITCIMLMTYKFRTMGRLLELLHDCSVIDAKEQKVILVDIYKMHMDLLE